MHMNAHEYMRLPRNIGIHLGFKRFRRFCLFSQRGFLPRTTAKHTRGVVGETNNNLRVSVTRFAYIEPVVVVHFYFFSKTRLQRYRLTYTVIT